MILNPPERDDRYIIFALIFLLSNRLQTIGDSFFEEISTKQWFVLVVLGIMKKPPTLNELSEAVGSSHQNVKQLVLKLEQKGFVEIYKDDNDARRLRIKATSKSVDFSRTYQEKSNRFIEQLFSNLSETDLSVTKNAMITLEDTLSKMNSYFVSE